MNLLKKDITPLDIMTKNAFENAIAVVIALGGSTNAVLHLIAIAREADVDLSLDDFTDEDVNAVTIWELTEDAFVDGVVELCQA